jgi:hypothetical protein
LVRLRLQPSFDDTKAVVVEIRGKLYVVLTSGKEQLAVFRVRNDGLLKRLARIPHELRTDGIRGRNRL